MPLCLSQALSQREVQQQKQQKRQQQQLVVTRNERDAIRAQVGPLRVLVMSNLRITDQLPESPCESINHSMRSITIATIHHSNQVNHRYNPSLKSSKSSLQSITQIK
jgi:hypothetical protein